MSERHRRPGNPGLRGRLVEKSIEAYVLSLETINRLSVKYRIESFSYLLCNAWELLLKAKLLEEGRAPTTIYTDDWRLRKKQGLPPHTIPIGECLQRVFPNELDPVRRNLYFVAQIRNESAHLVIGQLSKEILSLLQACVLNYHRKLVEWFDVSLSDRVPVGMMTIVFDLDPRDADLSTSRMKRKLGHDATRYLTKLQDELLQQQELLHYPAEFSVEIRFTTFIAKRPEGADADLSSGPDGTATQILYSAKDPSVSRPYRRTEVVEAINARLPSDTRVTTYDIQCICSIHNVKSRPDFFYQGKVRGSPGQYSGTFVDWVLQQFARESQFFVRMRDQRKQLAGQPQ